MTAEMSDSMFLRESPTDAGLVVVNYSRPNGTLLCFNSDTKKWELWKKSDGYAGYTLRFDGHDFEFVTSGRKNIAINHPAVIQATDR